MFDEHYINLDTWKESTLFIEIKRLNIEDFLIFAKTDNREILYYRVWLVNERAFAHTPCGDIEAYVFDSLMFKGYIGQLLEVRLYTPEGLKTSNPQAVVNFKIEKNNERFEWDYKHK